MYRVLGLVTYDFTFVTVIFCASFSDTLPAYGNAASTAEQTTLGEHVLLHLTS